MKILSLFLLLSSVSLLAMQPADPNAALAAHKAQLTQLVTAGNNTLRAIAVTKGIDAAQLQNLTKITSDIGATTSALATLISKIKADVDSNAKDPNPQRVFEDIGVVLRDGLQAAPDLILDVLNCVNDGEQLAHPATQYQAQLDQLKTLSSNN